jgi:hypothetical protein
MTLNLLRHSLHLLFATPQIPRVLRHWEEEGSVTKAAAIEGEEEESRDEEERSHRHWNFYISVRNCHRSDAAEPPARCGATVATVVCALCGGS